MKSVILSLANLSVALLLTLPLFSQKQSGVIRGKIFAPNGEPAVNVTVELQKLKRTTVTDNAGGFIFQHLPSLDDSLVVSLIESKILASKIELAEGDTVDVGEIHLQSYVMPLQNVEITGRLEQSYKSDYTYSAAKAEIAVKDVPQSVSTITKELIKDKMALNLKDIVTNAAGVSQYSGYDEYTIRGFRAENAHSINGLRGYNTTYTNAMLVNIERVEIIKGPSASLYGNCDPGGTINLVTKKPLENKQAEADISAGSWNHFRLLGDVTGPVNKTESLLYRFNAGFDNSNSFRDHVFSKSYEFAPSVSFIPNNRIQLNVDFSISRCNTVLDRGQPGFEDDTSSFKSTPNHLTVIQPGDKLTETDRAAIASLSYKINDRISFTSGYLNYVTDQDVAEHGINSYITNDSVALYYTTWNYHTTTTTSSNFFTFRLKTGKIAHELLAGYDYVQSKVQLQQQYYELPDQFGPGSGIVGTLSVKNPQYFQRPVSGYKPSDFDNDATDVDADIYQTQGLYVQELTGLGRWKLLVGLREEFYRGQNDDSTGAEKEIENVFLPRAGLVYTLNSNINLYATYNKGFDPFEASISTQVFNAPFKPIVSELFEMGGKGNFFSNKLSATMALYRLTIQNVAVNANNISNPDLYVQRGESLSRGIELEVNGNILSNLSIAFSYAYCLAKLTKSQLPSEVGSLMPNAPSNTSGSWIKYIFQDGIMKRVGISIGHSQVSVRSTLVKNITLPGYLIFNAGMQYSLAPCSIALNVCNLTNKTYWQSAYNHVSKWPGAPRNFMINFSYRF